MINMDWKEENNQLTKEFEFSNFTEAIEFVSKIHPLAEKANHHPDILIHSYKKVKIMLVTHDQGKITQYDHDLAAAIDSL